MNRSMISFDRHRLKNGLQVVVHRDQTTPMAAVNVLYDVGARDEHPDRTGFAHLFEHLMFEGSANIPRFDYALQLAGGENNAFTTNDITNYYLNLPARNLETAFWLESDRMTGLDFSDKNLDTQKNVVTEEFRQSYLNQPYGDAWLLLRQLAYSVHPYRWATIGREVAHIRDASLDEVKRFFSMYYQPANAILSVAGNVEADKVFALAEKWFGDILPGKVLQRQLPAEPAQQSEKRLTVNRDVPQHQIFMAFHMCARSHKDFHAADLISDILSNGESARLPERLLYDRKVFSEVNAYITGNIDPGLFVITGKPHHGTDPAGAEDMLWKEAADLTINRVLDKELQKVKNRVEAARTFSDSNVMAKAMNLAYYELQGDAALYNEQTAVYDRVTAEEIKQVACSIFRRENMSVLHYGNSST